MKETVTKRLVAAAVSFIGGGIASMIILGLTISIFDLDYQSVWPGTEIGASISGLTGLFFPGLTEVLGEFIG
jgi:hypothetical protein